MWDTHTNSNFIYNINVSTDFETVFNFSTNESSVKLNLEYGVDYLMTIDTYCCNIKYIVSIIKFIPSRNVSCTGIRGEFIYPDIKPIMISKCNSQNLTEYVSRNPVLNSTTAIDTTHSKLFQYSKASFLTHLTSTLSKHLRVIVVLKNILWSIVAILT